MFVLCNILCFINAIVESSSPSQPPNILKHRQSKRMYFVCSFSFTHTFFRYSKCDDILSRIHFKSEVKVIKVNLC